MRKPQITAIIPTFRRPKMLRRAIKSVLAQTYPHFQVMVLDNASGDETPEVVAELAREDPRVKYHCHPENIGAFLNFDYGMRHVETPFFAFLGDDDVVLPHFYETVMKGFEACPEAMFSAGLTAIADPNLPICRAKMAGSRAGCHNPPRGALDMLLIGCPNWTGIVFRKDVMQHVGYLAPNVVTADTEFIMRIAMKSPFVSSLRLCALRLRHAGSFSENRGIDFYWPSVPNMIASLMRVDGVSAAAKRELRVTMVRQLRQQLLSITISGILAKDHGEASLAAAILRVHLRNKTLGFVLDTMMCVTSAVPGMTRLFGLFMGLRRSLRRGCRRLRNRRVTSMGGRDGLVEAERWLGLVRDTPC